MPDREFLEGSERAKGVTMNKRSYRRSRIPERETLVDQLLYQWQRAARKPVHDRRPTPKKFGARLAEKEEGKLAIDQATNG